MIGWNCGRMAAEVELDRDSMDEEETQEKVAAKQPENMCGDRNADEISGDRNTGKRKTLDLDLDLTSGD